MKAKQTTGIEELPTVKHPGALLPVGVQRSGHQLWAFGAQKLERASHAAHHSIHWGADAGFPSEPILGVLPVRRVIPMEVHSVEDYVGAVAAGVLAMRLGTRRGVFVGGCLAASGLAVSLLTDYRLRLKKLISIEAHEVIDYVWSLTAAATPWACRGAARTRGAAWGLLAVAASHALVSAFTDYRGWSGVGRARHPLRTGPVGA